MHFEEEKNSFYRNKQLLLTALLLGLLITTVLQLSIRFFSKLRPAEEVAPELMVSLLTFPEVRSPMKKIEPVQQKKVSVKPKYTKKKEQVKKEIRKKTVKPKKSNYSALARKVEKIEPVQQKDAVSKKEEKRKETVENYEMPTPVPFFKLTEAPRFLHKEPLEYPESMRAIGNTGVVRLSVLIDKYGVVRKVTIIKSAGSEFDDKARKAIMSSTFFAAKVKGKPVASLLKLSVKFNLI